MNKLFSFFTILYCGILTSYGQALDYANPEILGNIGRTSALLTPLKPYVGNAYPVFEITVPAGYTEVQVRASLTNFEPGFLLKKDAVYTHNYIPTGETVNSKKKYKALGTNIVAQWTGTEWAFGQDGLTSADDVEHPWLCTTFSGGTGGVTYSAKIEYFVYRTCTTGEPADEEWGEGSGDPDPWVYIANQTATPGDNTEFKRQQWDSATALTGQLQSGGTPGYKIIFQPSRGNLGAIEWMQQNADKLVWIYQVEDVAGKPQHPNGSDVWNSMVPAEWRTERVELFTFDTP
jgi:hypothetical protein